MKIQAIGLLLYLLLINFFAFFIMGLDKAKAKKHKWRISEMALFVPAILGGSAGSLFGMRIFRHKTRHKKFTIGMPLLFVVQIVVGLFLYARFIEPDFLFVKKEEISIGQEITPCRIVFFSDTHFGSLYPENKIEEIVEKINRQKPDLVIFGGDFLDNYARDRSQLNLDYLQEELKKINAPYGKFCVFGNHDYGGGAFRVYEETMNGGGFTLLKNENCFIEDLNIRLIGFDDYLLGKTDPSHYKIKSGSFHVIISHEPDVVEFMEASGGNLVLSGHSHGGQVSLPFLTKRILPPGARNFIKGLYTPKEVGINDKTPMFVSKGIGMTVIPFRFLSPPEIIVLDLKTQD